jgi:uncharacterized protein (DUF362 family)
MPTISRRDFLKYSGGAALGALLVSQGALLAGDAAPRRSRVAMAHGRDPARLLADALDALGGARLLARPGERIVLKPTLAWNRPPHLAANTSPAVVKALAGLALDAGAREVLVLDRTAFRADLCYIISGAAAALASLRSPRVRLVSLTPSDFLPLPGAPTGEGQGGGLLPRQIVEADRVINVPQAKHHPRRILALGAANLAGVIGGGQPLSDGFLARVLDGLRPDLTIVDASRFLARNGPAGGDPADVVRLDALVVGADPLAVDACTCRLLGTDARRLVYLSQAADLGLGQPDLRFVEIEEVGA